MSSASNPPQRYARSRFMPTSSLWTTIMVIIACSVTSTTKGYDGSMMQSLNELPSYTTYFGTASPAIQAVTTCSIYFGGCTSALVSGPIANRLGRRTTLRYAAIWTIFSAILQSASQNVAMFVVSRAFVGFGITLSMIAATAYAAETLPLKWRGWGVGLIGDLYYVGSFVSSGVTYGTSQIASTWAWRLPSALQAVFSIVALSVLFIVPESPRWLAMQDRNEEALDVLAIMNADGDSHHPDTRAAFQEVMEMAAFDKTGGRQASIKQVVKSPDLRMRVILVCSASVCAMLSGNNSVSFYFGNMLDNAGITDSNTQLEITMILNAWCLVVAIIGTHLLDKFGRKTIALVSNTGMVVTLFLVGGLTAAYGTSNSTSGIYGTVASIFLFQGVYSLCWTPLIMLYPAEILTYNLRVYGVGLMEFLGNCFGLMSAYAFPFGFAAIGWKFYMINAGWDVCEVLFVAYYWVETVGLSLEEIDDKFVATYGGRRNVVEGLDLEEKLGGVVIVSKVGEKDGEAVF